MVLHILLSTFINTQQGDVRFDLTFILIFACVFLPFHSVCPIRMAIHISSTLFYL